jgi:diacylglycerol kinase
MARTWRDKFRDAFRGLWRAIRSERSFAVHLPMALFVGIAGGLLRVELGEGCILAVCVTMVLGAEMFNTALERLARGVDRQYSPDLGAALDLASGAVLVTAVGAALVGGTILLNRLGLVLGWWA